MKQNVICIQGKFSKHKLPGQNSHAELEFPGLTTGKFYENENKSFGEILIISRLGGSLNLICWKSSIVGLGSPLFSLDFSILKRNHTLNTLPPPSLLVSLHFVHYSFLRALSFLRMSAPCLAILYTHYVCLRYFHYQLEFPKRFYKSQSGFLPSYVDFCFLCNSCNHKQKPVRSKVILWETIPKHIKICMRTHSSI